MAVSSRFKLLLAALLPATLGIKLLVAGSIENPADARIALATAPFLAAQGFEIAGPVTFAGRDALAAARGGCLVYVVPVAQQGWHQATVRHALEPQQTLWFVFGGELFAREQPRWRPLLTYYRNKALRYTGIDMPYPPVLAIAASGDCRLETIDWTGVPAIPFGPDPAASSKKA